MYIMITNQHLYLLYCVVSITFHNLCQRLLQSFTNPKSYYVCRWYKLTSISFRGPYLLRAHKYLPRFMLVFIGVHNEIEQVISINYSKAKFDVDLRFCQGFAKSSFLGNRGNTSITKLGSFYSSYIYNLDNYFILLIVQKWQNQKKNKESWNKKEINVSIIRRST